MEQIRYLGFLLKDVSNLWVRHFQQLAAQIGLTLNQAKVLVHLAHSEGCTQARLAELSDTDPMTLVRILDRMQKDGWLERRPDVADRRAYRLFLTPASDPVLQEIERVGAKARGEALTGVSSDERTQLMAVLARIQGNLLSLLNEPPRPAGPPGLRGPVGTGSGAGPSSRRGVSDNTDDARKHAGAERGSSTLSRGRRAPSASQIRRRKTSS